MKLEVITPASMMLDAPVSKVIAEGTEGSFCLLPRHIDTVVALVPGILLYVGADGEERYFGIDEGVLVKCAGVVSVSTANAVAGSDLATLRDVVRERYVELDERARLARNALARLEAGVVRRFVELQEPRP